MYTLTLLVRVPGPADADTIGRTVTGRATVTG
jgi:hypothetical protein